MDFYIAIVSLAVQNSGVYIWATPNYGLGLLAMASAVAYTAGCLMSGTISDRLGRRRCVLMGCLGTGVAWAAVASMPRWEYVLLVMPIAGASLSLFWPSIQAWIAELTIGGRRELNRNLGLFNILWSVGLMVGPVTCGYLWLVDRRLTLYLPAALSVVLGACLLAVPRGTAQVEAEEEDRAPHEDGDLFLKLAWFGNFASWFGMGTVLAMFPKLGAELAFTPPAVGWVLFAARGGQVLLFIYTRYEDRWQYKLWPLLVAQAGAIVGMAMAVWAQSGIAFGAGFALGGACGGITYVASLFYALHGRSEGKGKTSGLHEAVLGSGGFLGPLTGGFVAQHLGLRAPFTLAALVLAAACVAQLILWHARARGVCTEAAGTPGADSQ